MDLLRTISGGNAEQRAWLRTQFDARGRLPPFQNALGTTIWLAFICGIPIVLLMGFSGVSSSIQGPVAIGWGVIGALFALRQYRWLKTNSDFQALAH